MYSLSTTSKCLFFLIVSSYILIATLYAILNSKSKSVSKIYSHKKYQYRFEEKNIQSTILTLPEAKYSFSSLRISSLYGMNFATACNICVKPDYSKKVYVYSKKFLADLPLKRRSGFNHGWDFQIISAPIPHDATRVKGTTIILSPAYRRHVTHFAESTLPMWHAISNPNRYPVHSNPDNIFLKQIQFAQDLDWNQKILSFLYSNYMKNVTIMDASLFSLSSLVCFEKAGLIGAGLHEFGFFANVFEAQTFRRKIISYYNIVTTEKSTMMHKSRCLVMQRQKTRRLVNRDEVITSIEETGLFDCRKWHMYLHGEMETMSFQEQLSVISNTQFLVGLHGSGLINSIFLSADSVTLDLLPDNYFELEWHNFASKAGVRFYFMFLRDRNCKNQCNGNIITTSKVKCRSVMSCNHDLEDFKLLQVIAMQSDFHIRVAPNIILGTYDINYSAGLARNDAALILPLHI